MSPTPLIELQRRLAEAGRIRMGEKGDRGQPQRLTTWRITSPTKELVEQAAGLYGGEPKPWDSPTGQQFEVVTTTADLPVLCMPGYSFRQGYEFRTSPTLVERRCDGVEMDDGSPCLCNSEGFKGKECDLVTRLTVALPELTTMLGWRLETKGDNAARELLASMDLVRGVSAGRMFVPARLRIVERRGNVDGQAVRYVVPVIDVSVRYAELIGGEPSRELAALPAGYTPIEPRASNGVTLEEGLREAETQQLSKPPRVQLPEDDDILDAEDPRAPLTGESRASAPGSPSPAVPSEPDSGEGPTLPPDTSPEKPLTKPQATKLNVLVGKLRDERGLISTDQLYAALAKSRNVDVEVMVGVLDGARDDAGDLHWGPLRDSLVRSEASDLIERLQKLEENAPVAT